MGKAIIRISEHLMLDLLQLSNNFDYKSAGFNFDRQVFEILVEHDELPDTEKGEIFPILNIEYKRSNCEVNPKITNFLLTTNDYITKEIKLNNKYKGK
jgi:hypothetical protein